MKIAFANRKVCFLQSLLKSTFLKIMIRSFSGILSFGVIGVFNVVFHVISVFFIDDPKGRVVPILFDSKRPTSAMKHVLILHIDKLVFQQIGSVIVTSGILNANPRINQSFQSISFIAGGLQILHLNSLGESFFSLESIFGHSLDASEK